MSNTKQSSKIIIGFINTTIKEIRIAQGKPCTTSQAHKIIWATLEGIDTEEVKNEVRKYCKKKYDY